ncbi:response regulator transcription factor [Dinghuibacter silviterrae]|uniref:LuxR family two component transcriptional regulator n=1 Tax=Dinghuibacter silviterrae TaxID=1539049 RepID=A0A4R8DRQ9_9BACT|nr:response regulator transcription factor [Dinghuibacter silviterrae]TDX00904.1 LuxR family two component transcriptional regulator [Dinghuibacter silviterrae]
MEGKIKLGIVEDQSLFREGIKALLKNWDCFTVVFESPDGFSVIDRLKQSPVVPDVMLVDLSLPPQLKKEYTGLHVTLALLEHFPAIRILILSVHDDENFISELIKHGAHGYLVKDADPEEVYEAILSVYTKGSYVNARTLSALQNTMGRKAKTRKLLVKLSRRELEILQLTCQQLTAEEIGKRLFISVKTVNGHRNNLLLKTGSKNVAGLVLFAVKNDLVNLV